MELVKRENVREPGAANEVDTVIYDFQQRAMTGMNAGPEVINPLLLEIEEALKSTYSENNAGRWCRLFELKVILHTHLQPRENAPEEASEFRNFGKTLKDYFKEACEQQDLDFLKSILALMKSRQADKYREVIRVDNAYIKTVLDTCVVEGKFGVVALILANFPEEFRGYVLSEISKINPQAALDLYGKTELQDYFKALKNEPAFVIAARAGDHTVVEYCLKAENPPELNACERHMPVLHAAVESGQEIVVRSLLNAGADINLAYQGRTALSIAMCCTNSVLVSILLTDNKFDWLQNKNVIELFEIFLNHSNDFKAAKEIVRMMLQDIASIGNPTEISQLLRGQTPLSLAIQLDRNVAGKLIEKGIGVFDLNAEGNTPSYCIAQARDEGLMAELKSYYARHCSEITTLFLNSDYRICKPLTGRSSCTLVLPLVNDWLELKQPVFDELSQRVKNAHTTCAELRKIRDQINNPKGPLMQFFGIGHGAHFWQSKSPWPEKLEPLLNTIQARLAQAYSVVPISQIKK